ncbi:hypothetical protein FKM82_026766, partial [Ascaphus truei]
YNDGQSVNQTLVPQCVFQGEAVLVECTYTVSGFPYLSWYLQYPDKAPEMLIPHLTQNEHKGFSAKHDKSKTSFHLSKGEAEVTDSGEYYCAVRDTLGSSPASA